MIRSIRALPLLLLLCLTAVQAHAQVATGTPPYGSFGGGPEIINLANLNSHIVIPVLHKPGRGTNFAYDLSYDSSVWYPVGVSGHQTWNPVADMGWRAITEAATGYVNSNQTQTDDCGFWKPLGGGHEIFIVTGYTYSETNWVYHDALGIRHPFNGSTTHYTGSCTNIGPDTSFTATSIDGSGYQLQATGINGTVTSRLGAIVLPPIQSGTGAASVTDRNGNQLTADSGGHYYDTLSSTTPVLTIAGSGTTTSPLVYTYTPPNTTSSRCASTNTSGVACYTMNYTNYTVATNFGISGITEYKSSTAVPLVSSIVLPDGSQYTFNYETTPTLPASGACTPYSGTTCVTARIASVTVPTGGILSYSYSFSGCNTGNNGIFSDGSASCLQRTTPDGTWTYVQAKAAGAASTTTVTDPQNNQTVIQFQGIFETQRQIYQGTSSSGTLLQTLNICYNGNATNCTTTAVTLPISRRTVTMQFTGGKQSKTDTFLNANGLQTEFDEYDYGNTSPVLLRKSITTYASLGNGIVDMPASVTLQDGVGNTKAKITYGYDETSVTATTGTPQHVPITGSRGNRTTISRLVQGTTTLTRTFTQYDTGNIKSFTDTNGAVTTANYSSTGSCGNSFVTSLNLPLGLSRSSVWNCTGGVVTSATDENGQVASTTYNDPYYWRPAAIKDAQNNTTNMTYTGATSSESILLYNGGQSTQDVLTTVDGLGRIQLVQRRQAPNSANFDSIETDYNSLGHQYRTTIPYVGTAGQTNSSAPATINLYDALQRLTQATDGGGGVLSKSYIQNDVLRVLGPAPAGENSKRKQFEYDGLGRLSSVCEITGSSGSGNCAQTSPQIGYWSQYTYDVSGDLTGVVQNSQSSGMQTRNYVFDMLGRMTSETNPETGTTTYSYDSATGCSGSSNGDLIKKLDAVGNTACFAYDGLHRVTGITYSGPYSSNSPNKYFIYDSATVNGILMSNTKLRLAEAYTATCSTCTKITDVGYSYDARGEVSDIYESTPHSGSYYHINASYWPNKEVNQLGGVPGLPTMTYGVDGEGRGYSVSASSGQNPVQSILYNVFEEPTSANFGSGDSDSFTYDPNTGRVTQYKFNINGQSEVGNLGWNQNRTLSTLAITDPFNSTNTQNCSYSFDDLTRLASSNCGSVWSQTFGYDPFGNITSSGSTNFSATYNTSTNRISQVGGFSPTYDSNGNLLSDPSHTYTWNIDGRPVSIDSVSITYDALNRAVEQNRSGSYTEILYSPTGNKLALMNGQTLMKAYVPLPSGATAVYTASGLSYYRHADWLGSSRLASTPTRTVYSDSAYSPFGLSYAQSGSTDVSFTSQNQDTVPGLYDFPAREYEPGQGRWISPDPSGLSSVNPRNPKSWNRYSYALNNPLSMVDPNGECSQPAGLQPGQIGLCTDLYISTLTVPGGIPGVAEGLGDNRGPVGDNANATYRVELQIIYDPQSNSVEGSLIAGTSVVVLMGQVGLPTQRDFSIGLQGSLDGSEVTISPNSDGTLDVSLDLTALNGFAWAPGAPQDPILLNTSWTFFPDGSVTNNGGDRSGYPSIEEWVYQSGQDPFNLLSMPETKISDLGSLNQQIPENSNDPSTGSVVVTGADGGDGGGDIGGGGGGGGGGEDSNDPGDETPVDD